jgi:hypothetical protein
MPDLIKNAGDHSTEFMGCPIHLIELSTIPIEELKGTPEVKAAFCALQSGTVGKFTENMNYYLSKLTQIENKTNRLDYALIAYSLSAEENIEPVDLILEFFNRS